MHFSEECVAAPLVIFDLYFSGGFFLAHLNVLLASYADKINSYHSRLPFFPNLCKLKIMFFLICCFNHLSANFCYLDR